MAGPMVYFPGSVAHDGGAFRERGIASLLGGGDWLFKRISRGPDGEAGVFAFFEPLPSRPGRSPLAYEPDSALQQWENFGDRYWLGIDVMQPPTADDLQRETVHSGEWVVLRDGNQWLVPAAEMLPHVYGFDAASGETVRQMPDEHAEFYRRVCDYSKKFMPLDAEPDAEQFVNQTMIFEGGLTFCSIALEKNYRMCPALLALLKLIDDRACMSIILAAIGATTYRRILEEKKTA